MFLSSNLVKKGVNRPHWMKWHSKPPSWSRWLSVLHQEWPVKTIFALFEDCVLGGVRHLLGSSWVILGYLIGPDRYPKSLRNLDSSWKMYRAKIWRGRVEIKCWLVRPAATGPPLRANPTSGRWRPTKDLGQQCTRNRMMRDLGLGKPWGRGKLSRCLESEYLQGINAANWTCSWCWDSSWRPSQVVTRSQLK